MCVNSMLSRSVTLVNILNAIHIVTNVNPVLVDERRLLGPKFLAAVHAFRHALTERVRWFRDVASAAEARCVGSVGFVTWWPRGELQS